MLRRIPSLVFALALSVGFGPLVLERAASAAPFHTVQGKKKPRPLRPAKPKKLKPAKKPKKNDLGFPL